MSDDVPLAAEFRGDKAGRSRRTTQGADTIPIWSADMRAQSQAKEGATIVMDQRANGGRRWPLQLATSPER